MTAAAAFTALVVGAWAGGALVWMRTRDRIDALDHRERDLLFRQAQLERQMDIVADERRKLNRERGCGR